MDISKCHAGQSCQGGVEVKGWTTESQVLQEYDETYQKNELQKARQTDGYDTFSSWHRSKFKQIHLSKYIK